MTRRLGLLIAVAAALGLATTIGVAWWCSLRYSHSNYRGANAGWRQLDPATGEPHGQLRVTVNRFQGLELWLGSVGFFADAPNGAQLRKASLVTWVPRWARASLIPWEIGAQAWPQQAVRADRHVMSAGWP